MFEWIGALDSQADWGSNPGSSSSLPLHFFQQVLIWLSLGAKQRLKCCACNILALQGPGVLAVGTAEHRT